MKNLKSKLKIGIIGISLLSINTFAQDYVYQGVKNVEATIGNSEGDSGQEIVSADCYDPANIGKTIQAQGCAGLKIVDNTMLRNMVLNQDINTPENNYSDTNIFTGQVTNINGLFCNLYSENSTIYGNCTLKNPIYSISNWDVSNVIDMGSLFIESTNFNQDISNWNIESSVYTNNMFQGVSNFNQDISNWNMSNVLKTSYMFYNASSFNQPLNNWNVSNVNDMHGMFEGASNFNQPLNNWDVSNVNSMYNMFEETINFNQNISNWCVINFSDEPNRFSYNAILSNENAPEWGSCP